MALLPNLIALKNNTESEAEAKETFKLAVQTIRDTRRTLKNDIEQELLDANQNGIGQKAPGFLVDEGEEVSDGVYEFVAQIPINNPTHDVTIQYNQPLNTIVGLKISPMVAVKSFS